MLGKYAFRMRQGPATVARGTFNDLPFFRESASSFRNTLNNADHLLVPGENTMTLDVWGGPPSPIAPNTVGPVVLLALKGDEDADGIMTGISWPAEAIEAGENPDALEMPFSWTVHFMMPDDHPPPIYANNPQEDVPIEGTADLHEAVRRLHDALARQSAADFVAACRLKLSEIGRFYGNPPETSEAMMVRAYEARFAKKFDVAPLEPEQLLFESRAKKRAVYVSRRDGKPVLSAYREEGDDATSFDLDPIFVRQGTAWTLLR